MHLNKLSITYERTTMMLDKNMKKHYIYRTDSTVGIKTFVKFVIWSLIKIEDVDTKTWHSFPTSFFPKSTTLGSFIITYGQ